MRRHCVMPLELQCGSAFGTTVLRRAMGDFELSETVYPGGQTIPDHRHPRAQLCFVLRGAYRERYRSVDLSCEAGTIVLHVPGDVHSDRFLAGRGSRCFHIVLPDRLPAELDPALIGPTRRLAPRWHLHLLVTRLREIDDVSALDTEEVTLSLLSALRGLRGPALAGAVPGWLERVREQVHHEFRRGPRLAELAEAVGVHRVHLARAFRQRFGCTVGAYVRQRRIEVAWQRLAASDEPLTAVAFAAGFADQAHLTRTFSAVVGMTPGAFRRRMRTTT